MWEMGDASVGVRVARLVDAEAVGILTERVYRAGGWAGERYSAVLLDGVARIEHGVTFVAVVDGQVVGTVMVALPGTRFANIARDGEGEVRMLAVDEDVRGRGVAALLMDACERRIRDEGLAAVVLSTEPDMAAAHRLYERRGYRRRPEQDWRIGRVELLVYRRAPL
ncbi:GNAT family N-acetyltransferase [Embleya sp. AB8]|uniref:GNAT family N-acetyltransferase n=1 Tax=Embleya sp. AB8 TaxID=3156304 RepID=UPI003C76B8F0